MPLYVFRCPTCPDVERSFSMTRVPDAVDCDTCGADARRVVTAVGVRADTTATALIDATRATAERPAVVGGVPGRSSAPRRVSTDPRHRRLPRP